MYRYTAYGLDIASDIELPELMPARHDGNCGTAANAPPATIRLGRVVRRHDAEQEQGRILVWASPRDACVCYQGVATYHVTDGTQILIELAPGADDRAVRLFLLGPAISLLLHQRGLLVLHASAVSVGGQAVAFAAEKGEGKSTLAAALHAYGHPLVTDDLLAVEIDDNECVRVYPGFPQLKLMPDSAAQISATWQELPLLHPDYEKRGQIASDDFSAEPLPLARLFILSSGEDEAVAPLPPQQRFVELVRHSYLAQLLEFTGEGAEHFRQVVKLAQRVPVLRLQRRRSMAALASTVRLIEAEMAQPA
jgi:hypothetical protein